MRSALLVLSVGLIVVGCSGGDEPVDEMPIEGEGGGGPAGVERATRVQVEQLLNGPVAQRVSVCVGQHRQNPDEIPLPMETELTFVIKQDGTLKGILSQPPVLNNAVFGTCMNAERANFIFPAHTAPQPLRVRRVYPLN